MPLLMPVLLRIEARAGLVTSQLASTRAWLTRGYDAADLYSLGGQSSGVVSEAKRSYVRNSVRSTRARTLDGTSSLKFISLPPPHTKIAAGSAQSPASTDQFGVNRF